MHVRTEVCKVLGPDQVPQSSSGPPPTGTARSLARMAALPASIMQRGPWIAGQGLPGTQWEEMTDPAGRGHQGFSSLGQRKGRSGGSTYVSGEPPVRINMVFARVISAGTCQARTHVMWSYLVGDIYVPLQCLMCYYLTPFCIVLQNASLTNL